MHSLTCLGNRSIIIVQLFELLCDMFKSGNVRICYLNDVCINHHCQGNSTPSLWLQGQGIQKLLSCIWYCPAAVGLALIFLVGIVGYLQRVILCLKQNPGTTEDDTLMGQMSLQCHVQINRVRQPQ